MSIGLKEGTPRGILFSMWTSRRSAAIIVLALASVSLAAGCTSDPVSDEPITIESPSAGTVALVNPATFEAAAATDGVVLLDVRTPQEFAQGHIEGAVNIDIENPSFASEIAALDPTTTYAVYCRSGNRSATATQYLLQQGFAAPFELDGGIVAWDAAGLPTVR